MNLLSLYSLLPSGIRARLSPRLKTAMRTMAVKRVAGDFLMDLDLDEWFQNQLWHGIALEPNTLDLIGQLLDAGDTYVDVGAHVGYQTLAARRRVGPSGLVIAVEPQPANCAKILRNWEINDFHNVVVYPAAASATEYTITFHDQPKSDRARLSIGAASAAGEMPQRFSVPARRMDAVLAEHSIAKVALLKIDAEGHELQVVQGLGHRICDVQNLIVEIWDPSLPAYAELIALLTQAGFAFRTVKGERWSPPDQLLELNLWAFRP